VTGEYHGRFLIELLQNARDALLETDPETRGGVVRVRLTDEPALLVCNDGDPLRPDVMQPWTCSRARHTADRG